MHSIRSGGPALVAAALFICHGDIAFHVDVNAM
jgi:hypothetical protein